MAKDKLWVDADGARRAVAGVEGVSSVVEGSLSQLKTLTNAQGEHKWGTQPGAQQFASRFSAELQIIEEDLTLLKQGFQSFTATVDKIVSNQVDNDQEALRDFTTQANSYVPDASRRTPTHPRPAEIPAPRPRRAAGYAVAE